VYHPWWTRLGIYSHVTSNVKSIWHICKKIVKITTTLNTCVNFWFCGIKLLHQSSPFPFQTTYPPFHLHFVPNMHCVVSFDNILDNIRSHWVKTNYDGPLWDTFPFDTKGIFCMNSIKCSPFNFEFNFLCFGFKC
jgi:hypothetical protein